jgi:two-component system, LytTR family, response regulator
MMSELRALIVDDEVLARARLRRLLTQVGGVVIVGECGDGSEIAPAVRDLRPDVILLDVTMPEFSGFDALKRMKVEPPLVIFVTAHSDYAVQAFAVDAVDYLLKPVSAARLGSAIDKVRRALGQYAKPAKEYEQRLTVVQKGRTILMEVDKIEAVQAKANNICIYDGTRQVHLRGTLSNLATQLDPQVFLRVHRSILVRRSAVRAVESVQSGRYILQLASGRSVPTGRSYTDIVQRTFLVKARI